MTTGEVYADAGDEITEELLAKLEANGTKDISLLFIDNVSFGPHLRNTLLLTVIHAAKKR